MLYVHTSLPAKKNLFWQVLLALLIGFSLKIKTKQKLFGILIGWAVFLQPLWLPVQCAMTVICKRFYSFHPPSWAWTACQVFCKFGRYIWNVYIISWVILIFEKLFFSITWTLHDAKSQNIWARLFKALQAQAILFTLHSCSCSIDHMTI